MGDFWQPTEQMFGSLFQKPKMSQKLLEKPPFKYIFDIITETTKVTGYAKGLYQGEELDGNYFDNRDKKVAYLQKIIDLTQLLLKEEVQAKPAKIVSGLEPEQTNLMLQAIYRAAISGKNSDALVKKILGGGAEKEEPKQAPKKAEPKSEPKPEPKQEPKAEPKPEPKAEPKQAPKEAPKEKKVERGSQPEKQDKPAAAPQPVQQPKQEGRPQTATKRPPALVANQVVEQGTKKSAGNANVIMDNMNEDDDDDSMIVTAQQKSSNAQGTSKLATDAKKQIEAAKKVDEKPKEASEGGIKMEMKRPGKKTDKDSIKTQIAQNLGTSQISDTVVMQELIQKITKNANPLGKQLEFIQDDIESMNYEMQQWRKIYNVSKQKMVEMNRATDEAQQPLFDKIAEVEETMKDKKTKIQHLKAQIIKNKQQIELLLKSVMR